MSLKITDTAVALMVLKGEITSTNREKVDAVHFLTANGVFYKLPGHLQTVGNAVILAYNNNEEG